MKGHWLPYSAAELAWIEQHATVLRREAFAEFCTRFGRSDVSFANFNSLCKRKGWLTGRTGCFEKGIVPHNKGKPHPARGRAAQTQFKPGRMPHNTKYLGHERISKDGYVEISVATVNPHTGYWRRYVLKHVHLWTQANGPIPKGHCLKCVDGDKTNTDPSNWIPVPRALLPRLNGSHGRNAYDDAPAELKPVILAIAKLEHSAREKRRPAQ